MEKCQHKWQYFPIEDYHSTVQKGVCCYCGAVVEAYGYKYHDEIVDKRRRQMNELCSFVMGKR